VNALLQFQFQFLLAALSPGVYSASNRNEYQKQDKNVLSRALPARNDDNLTAINEPTV
jgi:hypothetical protein